MNLEKLRKIRLNGLVETRFNKVVQNIFRFIRSRFIDDAIEFLASCTRSGVAV